LTGEVELDPEVEVGIHHTTYVIPGHHDHIEVLGATPVKYKLDVKSGHTFLESTLSVFSIHILTSRRFGP
jgi:hypothetical protein